jgi:hypothetical protein
MLPGRVFLRPGRVSLCFARDRRGHQHQRLFLYPLRPRRQISSGEIGLGAGRGGINNTIYSRGSTLCVFA